MNFRCITYTGPGVAQMSTAAKGHLAASSTASRRPFAYKDPPDLKLTAPTTLFPEKTLSAAAIKL